VGVETAPLAIAVRAKSPLKTAQERLEYSSTLEKHQIRRYWPSATMYAPPNGKRHRNQFSQAFVPLARISRPAYAPTLPEGTYVFDRPGGFFKMARVTLPLFFYRLRAGTLNR
jgi:hypothetical protein